MALTSAICCFTAVALLATSLVESYNFNVYMSPWYGRYGGYSFDDYRNRGLSSPSVDGVDKIYILYKPTDVLAVQFSYRLSHGGCELGYFHGDGTEHGGSHSIINLSDDEYVARISGRYERSIRYLHFVIANSQTGRTRAYGFGYNRGQHFTIAGPIYAIYGRSGSRLDYLGVYLSTPLSGMYGYIHGTGFWDSVTSHVPAITRLYKVCVRHGADVDSVRFTYLTTTGTYTTGRYGGSGGSLSCFTLSSSEKITAVKITKNDIFGGTITGLLFTISNSNTYRTYNRGSYGRLQGSTRTLYMHSGVLGFHGHYISRRLTALGLIGHK